MTQGMVDRGRRSGRPWAKIREDLGVSLRELEDRTGINRGELSKIERGLQCPTPDQAWVLLAAQRLER